MKLSDYIINFFEEKNIKDMFFLPGGGCMHLVDSFGRSKINCVSLLHEQAVAVAAESYSTVTQKMGLALVTTGPGGTNAVTGVLSSYLDSTPVFFVSGQVKTRDLKSHYGVRQFGSQEADIVEIVKSITKYAVMVTDKNSIKYHLEKAWYMANEGRKGPVWLDIPLDIQGSIIEPKSLEGFEEPAKEEYDFSLKPIIDSIKEAKRPLIIAGNGLRKCKHKFLELSKKLNIPIIPTWKAIDLIGNDNPLFVGKCGTMGDRCANFAVQNADLIISLGSKMDFSITGFERDDFAPKAKKIIVDIDKAELLKMEIPFSVRVHADVCDVVDKLLESDVASKDLTGWKNKIKEWQKKYPIVLKEHYTTPITTYALIKTICNNLDENAVVVPASAGTVAEITFQAFEVKQGQKIRSNHGLGSMGYEIPSAIGACIAMDKKIVCIAGDGGMQQNLQELAVVAGRKLPIVFFVVNNGGYASIRNMQRAHFNGMYVGSSEESGLYLPNACEIARAYNIKTMAIETIEDLEKGVVEALSYEEPVICDVHVAKNCIVFPKVATAVLSDGTIRSGELHNMMPYLDVEEKYE